MQVKNLGGAIHNKTLESKGTLYLPNLSICTEQEKCLQNENEEVDIFHK